MTTPNLSSHWDIIIIGGGITGAGLLRQAARLGHRALLLEQNDFASGTSSRSSKLVHGGLRYLKQGQFKLTRDSVRERQNLLQVGAGLVKPLGFLLTTFKQDTAHKLLYRAGLSLYDLLAWQWSHQYYSARDFQMLAPHLDESRLDGGFRYGDAQTDDARLTLRVLREAQNQGAVAHNYARVTQLHRDDNGDVTGLQYHDARTDQTHDLTATIIINATGAWADKLRRQIDGERRLRPLRGSHLIFPHWRLPVAQAISFPHPDDGRPVFVFPWSGATLVGTTDVDHALDLDQEPRISPAEVAYLMQAVTTHFPACALTLDDVTATFAGVRPVIDTGQDDPSAESRDHVLWTENRLLTVTGGKLTTYHLIAQQALDTITHLLPPQQIPTTDTPLDIVTTQLPPAAAHLPSDTQQRLLGFYGADAAALVDAAQADELTFIPGTEALWAELRWAARAEAVHHLDDLLLRRVRLGLLLPDGGQNHLPRIRTICQPELGWDDTRWQTEADAYQQRWQNNYSLPPRHTIPAYNPTPQPEPTPASPQPAPAPSTSPSTLTQPLVLTLFATFLFIFWRYNRQPNA
ncbi:MAG TPA: glycerol-3-phosphate dehydrogenase/oxidase [Anaerolineae bacterium]|nr:glycerol-3-phosphate dehydrogenase/oxidase [Anaerolineae bacterium]